MDLREALMRAVPETLGLFGAVPEFSGEMLQSGLTSAHPVNVLVGITQGGRGNVVLGMSWKSALALVGGMMGGAALGVLDDLGKSALAELGNMLVGSGVRAVTTPPGLDIAPSTVVLGERVFLIVSWVPSRVLQFRTDGGPFVVRFALW